ncbi:hypothetical protein QTP88_020455 [Uroleucon formosanum]
MSTFRKKVWEPLQYLEVAAHITVQQCDLPSIAILCGLNRKDCITNYIMLLTRNPPISPHSLYR